MKILYDANNIPLCSYEQVGVIKGCTLVLTFNLLIFVKDNHSQNENKNEINIDLLRIINPLSIGFYPIESFSKEEKFLLCKILEKKGITASELILDIK